MPTKSLSLEEIAQEDDQTRLLTELQTSRTGMTAPTSSNKLRAPPG